MDTDWEVNYSKRKDTARFLPGGGEDTIPVNMESLYASVRSWVMEEDDNTHFPYWKLVGEYRNPVDPTLLSANF